MNPELQRAFSLLRASGRCTGAMIFALFGGGWLLVGLVFLRRFNLLWAALIGAFALLLAAIAFQMGRSQPEPALDQELAAQKEKDDRRFWVVNAVTYTAVFLLFPTLSFFKLQEYILPGFVGLVGLHFFPMPRLYQHVANQITGACMLIWAVTCVFLFRPDGDRIAAWVSVGAGALLWVSSASAILTAKRLFRDSSLVGA